MTAMFAYMTDLSTVEVDESCTRTVESSGHDAYSMLFKFMDDFLYLFCADDFVCSRLEVLELDTESLRIRARGFGEKFMLGKHPQGTEVKAITYSNMQIHAPGVPPVARAHGSEAAAAEVQVERWDDGLVHVYVIIDI